MPTTVANKRVLDQSYPGWTRDPSYAYVGRKARGMHFGNPFSHRPGGLAVIQLPTRGEAVRAFEDWYAGVAYQDIEPERRLWVRANLHTLRDKTLVCFCHPEECHADIYAGILNGDYHE